MARKKIENEQEELVNEWIESTPVEDVLSQGFGRYSKYVLQERAVPDVRDGLKPVQRRILYTMIIEGNTSSKPTRKCARTVGAVIGRFHPHGDTSVYEAMVRLSQDWKMRYPLIEFQGNNGSIDGDGPAAYRYTEARLSEMSELLVQDLNKKTVDMQLNFDDLEYEPIVLPGRFPNLLVNGSSGVAVGASTDIPPHNLQEVIDAICYRISHKKCTTDDLLEFIKGPDFPTGGIIRDTKSLPDLYRTGKGLIKLYATAETSCEDKYVNQIIIKDIPFGKDKSDFVNNIDKVRFANKLDAILEVRDETDREGIRICIDIKKDSDPENILNFLYSKNVLSNSVKFNMLVIDHNRPKVCSLLEVVDCYIEHQVDVLTRRSRYDLDKAKARLHIVEGLIKALSMIDKVVALIRSSKDKQDARMRLVSELDFSEEQAEALLTMQLYRLSNTDVTTLINEGNSLRETIKELTELLEDPEKMNRLIKNDLNAVKSKYKDERRTLIQEGTTSFEVDKKALISKDEVMVVFTKDGYFKRTQMRSYTSSNGQLPGFKQGDVIKGIIKCYTTDTLLAFTNFGNYLSIPVYQLTDTKWKEEGAHINESGSIAPNEKIIGGVIYSLLKEGVSVVLISKSGQIKRTDITEFETSKVAKTIKCFRLGDDDELAYVTIATGRTKILVVTQSGYSSLFSETSIEPIGIRAGGVKSITPTSKEKTQIAGLLSFEDDERCQILVLTDRHAARIVDSHQLELSIRLGPKQQIFKTFKSDIQKAVYVGKLPYKSENNKINITLDNNVTMELDLSAVKVQPMGNYLKENLPQINYTFDVIDAFNFDIPYVNENTKVTKNESKSNKIQQKTFEPVEEDKEEEHEKLSLFDFVDDDD